MKKKLTLIALVPTFFLAACGEKKEEAAAPKSKLNPAEMAGVEEVKVQMEEVPAAAPPATTPEPDPTDAAVAAVHAAMEKATGRAPAEIQLVTEAVSEAVADLAGEDGTIRNVNVSEVTTLIENNLGDLPPELATKAEELLGKGGGDQLGSLLQALQSGDTEKLDALKSQVQVMVAGEDGAVRDIPIDPETGKRMEFHELVGDKEGLKDEFKSIIGKALEEAGVESSETPDPVPAEAP